MDGFNFYSASSANLRFYDAANADCSGTAAGLFAINYNGTSLKTAVETLALGSGQVSTELNANIGLTRYMSVPYTVTASTPITVEVSYANSTTGAYSGGLVGGKAYGKAQIAIINKSGQVLAVKSAVLISGDGATALGDQQTISVTVSTVGTDELFVIFNRSTDATGGLRVFSVKTTQ